MYGKYADFASPVIDEPRPALLPEAQRLLAQEPRRVAQQVGVHGLPRLGTADEVLDAHLVLDVVLVEQRSLQQVEVALDRTLLPRIADAQHVLLPGRGVEPDVLRELEQPVLAREALELVERARVARDVDRVVPLR